MLCFVSQRLVSEAALRDVSVTLCRMGSDAICFLFVCSFLFCAASTASVGVCLEGYSFRLGCYMICTALARMISFSYAVVLELFAFVYAIILVTAPFSSRG